MPNLLQEPAPKSPLSSAPAPADATLNEKLNATLNAADDTAPADFAAQKSPEQSLAPWPLHNLVSESQKESQSEIARASVGPVPTSTPLTEGMPRVAQNRVASAFWASVPAIFLLGLGLVLRDKPLPTPLSVELSSASSPLAPLSADLVVDEAQTLVVQPVLNKGSVTWHAQLREARGITGRAPIAGQITRVWVKEGQHVEVGDRILRIAASGAVLPDEPAPRLANGRLEQRAEAAQVEASRDQNRLQGKMARAQAQLAQAQERVARAKTRIAETTEIVRLLQAGIASGDANPQIEYSNSVDNAADSSAAPVDNENAQHAATEARANAVAEARNAARLAERAQSRANAARASAADAEAAARSASQKARSLRETRERDLRETKEAAQAPADEPLARSDSADAKAKPKDTPRPLHKTSVSQSAVDDADARAQNLTKSAAQARDKARSLANEASQARDAAQNAQAGSSRLAKQLQVFGDDNQAPKVVKPRAPRKTTHRSQTLPSVEDAVRMVRAATEESADAQREARRLQVQVEEYAQQAKTTGENLASSSSELGSEQQSAMNRTLNQTLETNLSVMRAPASGTISWVASATDTIGEGAPILRMGNRGALQARFVDYSGLWRNLQTDSVISALVSEAEQRPSATRSQTSRNKSSPSGVSASSTQVAAPSKQRNNRDSIEATAYIESISPPENAGEPAFVRALVLPKNNASLEGRVRRARRLRSGMTIWCSLDRNGKSAVVSVPNSCIMTAPHTPPIDQPVNTENAITALSKAPNATALNDASSKAVNNAAVSDAAVSDANALMTLPAPAVPPQEVAVNAARAPENGARSATSSTRSNKTNVALIAVLTPVDAAAEVHRIEWRRVELGAAQNGAQQIVSGLLPGERIALQPAALWNYAQSKGDGATVRLSRAS